MKNLPVFIYSPACPTKPVLFSSSVEWGVSDGGHFFCKNCHNVIEVGK